MSTTIEEGLVAFMGTVGAFTAIVGVGAASRFYPAGAVPDDVKTPYATYRKVSGPRDQTHGGSELARPRLQLSHWADDYLEAKQLAAVTVAALKDYHGAMGGVARSAAAVDNEIDLFVPEERRHQVIVDVLLWHTED